jgi:hemolysin III
LRTQSANRHLPNYSIGEERFNMISHIVGGGLGVLALVLCIVKAASNRDVYGIVSSAVYGSTLIMLFVMSSIYHGLKNGKVKRVLRVLDHCAIYLMIAGSYTPIALSALRHVNLTLGWVVFGVIWGLATLAITFTAIDLEKYKVLSMICYIGMGWGIIAVYKPTISAISLKGFGILLAGGILYTLGAVLYQIGKRKKYMHSVFHVTVLLGSTIHFLAILFYAL